MIDVEHERERVQRVGDGDGEERLDEEEVEGQPRQDGGEQRGPDAADERDDDDEQLVGEHVGGDRLLAADAEEEPGQQRPDDERDARSRGRAA